jgi:hypothetical protein
MCARATRVTRVACVTWRRCATAKRWPPSAVLRCAVICFASLLVCVPPQGSPVVAAVRQRLAGIEKEYHELDAVWFMAGSLFNRCVWAWRGCGCLCALATPAACTN